MPLKVGLTVRLFGMNPRKSILQIIALFVSVISKVNNIDLDENQLNTEIHLPDDFFTDKLLKLSTCMILYTMINKYNFLLDPFNAYFYLFSH